MVYLRGESLTHHTIYMKDMKKILAFTVIAASLLCTHSSYASTHINVSTGKWVKENDGVPFKEMEGPMGTVKIKSRRWAYPLDGEHGKRETYQMIESDAFMRIERKSNKTLCIFNSL